MLIYCITMNLCATFGALSPPSEAAGQPPPPGPGTTVASQPERPVVATEAVRLDEDVRLITGNNEPDVRLMGARRLLEAGSDGAVQRLARILQSSPADLAAQIAVCQAIGNFPSPPTALAEPLLRLLGDQRPGMSDAVSQALRRFKNGDVIQRLKALAADRDEPIAIREAAVRILGHMGDSFQAVASLIALIQEGTASIQRASLQALERATGRSHPDEKAALAWWEARRSMDEPAWLREVVEHRSDQTGQLREQARLLSRRLATAYREAYIKTPENERPKKLLELLNDPLAAVRNLGLDLINMLITDRKEVGPDVKAQLVDMIEDTDSAIRPRVAAIIGDLRLTESVPKLLDALGREPDYRTRAAMVNAIGRLNGEEAVPVLQARLEDDAAPVVGEAALALAVIGRRIGERHEDAVEAIAVTLSARFETLPTDDYEDLEVREKFLEAMARMNAARFRTIFKAEIAEDRDLRTRRAAIVGLGACGDAAAADGVRGLLTSSEPEVRLAAVQALGQCGQRKDDLEALAARLDSKSETEQPVRDRAWESYVAVAQRLPLADLLAASDTFARPGDTVAQRRRLDLLRSVTATGPRFKQLPAKDQVSVLERLGAAQVDLKEATAAVSTLEQALLLVPDRADPDHRRLSALLLTALLLDRQDRTAAQRIAELAKGNPEDGDGSGFSAIVDAVMVKVQNRIAAAVDAATFASAIRLIDLMSEAADGLGPDFVQRLEVARADAVARREAAIDQLLGTIATDPQAESRVLSYGRDLVLPRLYEKLKALPTTTAPAEGVEDLLIEVGRQLDEHWSGYHPGDPPEERAKAMEALKDLAEGRRPTVAPTTSAPSDLEE